MTDGKKKRPRKRQRKSKGSGITEEGGDEGEGEAQVKVLAIAEQRESEGSSSAVDDRRKQFNNDLQTSDASQAVKSQHQADKAVPTVSFYERTNPHKPSALSSLQGKVPRRYTISVAIPGSIILNAQSPELQSRLAGQLARSCAIFNVDEIVVFNEDDQATPVGKPQSSDLSNGNDINGAGSGDHETFDPNAFLARILQYVETPQYLRKSLFPMHRDLRMAGILAPLDCPHHLRYEEESTYREGVCVEAPHWAADQDSTWVYTGLRDPIQCVVKGKGGAASVPLGARLTVKMPTNGKKGYIVSPREPVQTEGLYWGYTTRLCNSLSEVISSPCWNEPYDLVIGTSERGVSLDSITAPLQDTMEKPALTPFRHVLIVFGGLSGLEVAVEKDPNINLMADDASELFDAWINVVEAQGSRTIRTEEALLITLARLHSTLTSLGQQGEQF